MSTQVGHCTANEIQHQRSISKTFMYRHLHYANVLKSFCLCLFVLLLLNKINYSTGAWYLYFIFLSAKCYWIKERQTKKRNHLFPSSSMNKSAEKHFLISCTDDIEEFPLITSITVPLPPPSPACLPARLSLSLSAACLPASSLFLYPPPRLSLPPR